VLSTSGGVANLSGIEVWTAGSASARTSFEETGQLRNNDLSVMLANPVKDVLRMQIDAKAAGETMVVLRNALGQEVLSTVQQLRAGGNTLQYSTTRLRPGLYILTLQKGGRSVTKRIIITR
jgi:hypothetical protein